MIRGIISVIKDKVTNHVFTIVLGACGAALFGYETGYETYNFIDKIRSEEWDIWQNETEKTQYLFGNYLWISVFTILSAVSIILMVLAIISMKKSNAAGYQNGGFDGYQAPVYEQNPTYMQNPDYDQTPNLTQYANESAYQQKICRVCGNAVEGKFCPKCGTPWQG